MPHKYLSVMFSDHPSNLLPVHMVKNADSPSKVLCSARSDNTASTRYRLIFFFIVSFAHFSRFSYTLI